MAMRAPLNTAYRQSVLCIRQRRASDIRFASFHSHENPLHQIESAIKSLNDFSSRLVKLSQMVDKPHVLIDKNTGLVQNTLVTLPQVVLHSRDANLKEFDQGVEARKLVLETAIITHKELRSLDVRYERLSKQMEAGKLRMNH